MPRLTRKSLTEASPARGRSRTPAKAEAEAASSRPSRSLGVGGKGKEAEVAESKRPRRSASRSKAATPSPASKAPAPAAAARESRSRSKSAAPKEKKATPALTKRGREKGAGDQAEEVEPKRAKSRGQSAGKSKSPASAGPRQHKGRSPAKAAPAKGKGKSPAARAATPKSRAGKSPARKGKSPARAAPASRAGKSPAAKQKTKGKSPAKAAATTTPGRAKSATRSPRTPAAETVSKKKEEAKKSTSRSRVSATPPARGSKSPRTAAAKSDSKADAKKPSPRGRAATASASTSKSRSRRSQEAEEPQEDAEQKEKENETKEAEKEQEEKDSEEVAKDSEADAEVKQDTEKDEDDDTEMKEDTTSINKEGITDDKSAKEAPEVKDADSKPTAEPSAEEAASDDVEGVLASEETVEAESESAMDTAEDTSQENLSGTANAEEPMEDSTAAVAQEPVKAGSVSAVPDSQEKNGETDKVPSPPRSAPVKRKFEEDSEELDSEPRAKQARLNGMETEQEMEGKESEPSAAGAEEDILKEYVVIDKDEVPAHDSSEVAASLPAGHKTPPPDEGASAPEPEEARAAEKEEAGSGSSGPVFVVPLTQAEEIRACAYSGRSQEDSLSLAVEVGSLTDSEISSRNLEVNEELSAAVSTEGDASPKTNMDDDPDNMAEKEPESTPATDVVAASSSSAADSSSIEAEIQGGLGSTSDPAKPPIPASFGDQKASASTILDPALSAPAVDKGVGLGVQSVSQSNSTPGGAQTSFKPSPFVPESVVQTLATASNVTPSLGLPDPAFLSTYSSPGILDRAYVPNPAVPAESIAPGRSFSLVSYNILAECNRVKADYTYTAEEFLGQGYRHSLLMKELTYLDGDVVCLQEVNPQYYHSTLLPRMKSLGYDGAIMCRTKDMFDEGEATFFKTSVFDLDVSRGVSLSDMAFQEVEKAGLSGEVGAALKKYLDRADVVLITRLRCKASGRVVTVGNIHVVWDFKRCPDVQCVQVACAIKEVVKVSGSGGAHMICGDFNSEWTTPAYQMVVDGALSQASVCTLQDLNNLELENGAKSLVSHLRQAFQHSSPALRSAYSTVTKSEPEVTSLTSFMESAVDYQFYTADSLVPQGVLKTPDQAVVKATGGIPSRDFPSDHVSMKSLMAFRC
ncbi:hypothetical protein ACOMHN_067366 [Nucella lapillus]